MTFLNDLHRHKIPCAVGSSASKTNVDFVLEKCRLEDDFSVVVTGDMVARRKPDPAIFLLAAELLGFVPGECLVFEDSESGIAAAKAAAMPVIAMATTLPREKLKKIHDGLIIHDFTKVNYETIRKIYG